MRELPILFSAPMVRAIIAGTKTQTRRLVKRENEPEPGFFWLDCVCREIDPSDTPCVPCAQRFGPVYAEPGDRLYVRETWALYDRERFGGEGGYLIARRADDPEGERGEWLDGPSVYDCDGAAAFVIEWAGETKRVEKLPSTLVPSDVWRPSILMPKAWARLWLDVESVHVERVQDISEDDARAEGCDETTPRDVFADLWRATYGADAWDRNGWVWVVRFVRAEERAGA